MITMRCLQSSAAFLIAFLCKYALEGHLFQRVALETQASSPFFKAAALDTISRLVFIRATTSDWLVMLVWLRVKAVSLS